MAVRTSWLQLAVALLASEKTFLAYAACTQPTCYQTRTTTGTNHNHLKVEVQELEGCYPGGTITLIRTKAAADALQSRGHSGSTTMTISACSAVTGPGTVSTCSAVPYTFPAQTSTYMRPPSVSNLEETVVAASNPTLAKVGNAYGCLAGGRIGFAATHESAEITSCSIGLVHFAAGAVTTDAAAHSPVVFYQNHGCPTPAPPVPTPPPTAAPPGAPVPTPAPAPTAPPTAPTHHVLPTPPPTFPQYSLGDYLQSSTQPIVLPEPGMTLKDFLKALQRPVVQPSVPVPSPGGRPNDLIMAGTQPIIQPDLESKMKSSSNSSSNSDSDSNSSNSTGPGHHVIIIAGQAPGHTLNVNPACFSADGLVQVEDEPKPVPLAMLRQGQRLYDGFAFTDVLGFLHDVPHSSRIVSIEHEGGELRVSASHLVLLDGEDKLASQVVVGDRLLRPQGAVAEVLALRQDTAAVGVLAPLTSSGLISVDGTSVSNYATVDTIPLTHASAHAAFFPARAAKFFGLIVGKVDSMHPLAKLYKDGLLLDRLLATLAMRPLK